MNTQISGMKKYLKFWEYKRLLRVRGIEDLEKEINLKLVNFELLINEAQSFHEACQDLNLIYPIVREHLKLSNKSLSGLDKKKYYIPNMIFYKNVVSASGRMSRKKFFKWTDISAALDNTNASLDERLLHMKVYFDCRQYFCRGRQIVGDLAELFSMKEIFDEILKIENLDRKHLPSNIMVK
jgi:yfa